MINSNKILGNILGNQIKKDSKSKNKEYLGYNIKQKTVGQYYARVYIIIKDNVELTDINGTDLYFSTYNQAKYYIENNLR